MKTPKAKDVNTEVRHAAMVVDKLLRDGWVGFKKNAAEGLASFLN